MLAKRIKYTDYNNNEREETFYFNLSKAEIMEMELSTSGGLEQMYNKLIETQDGEAIIHEFKKLILKSYGEKSSDGKRFVKSKELSEAFEQTEAYSMLFMELCTDAKAAADFVSGIAPLSPEDKPKLQALSMEKNKENNAET